jgi:hypothetical protein
VGWFRRSTRKGRMSRRQTPGEHRAAERTARAETALQETEQKIHQLADQAREDLKGTP